MKNTVPIWQQQVVFKWIVELNQKTTTILVERQPIIIYRKCGHAALTSQGNNSVSRDIRRVTTAGYPFETMMRV